MRRCLHAPCRWQVQVRHSALSRKVPMHMNVGRRQHQSCSTIDWFPLKARSADGLAADDALIGEEPAKLSRVSLTMRRRLRLGKACAVIQLRPFSTTPTLIRWSLSVAHAHRRITNVHMLGAEHLEALLLFSQFASRLRPPPMHSSPSRTAQASMMIELQPRLRCQAPSRRCHQRTTVPPQRPTHCPFAR
jgi:hypothetical protein